MCASKYINATGCLNTILHVCLGKTCPGGVPALLGDVEMAVSVIWSSCVVL
jgi:hypothetical protein